MGDAIEYCDKCENNVGCHLSRRCLNQWELRSKVWVDRYHPDTFKPRDHGKHSKKKKK